MTALRLHLTPANAELAPELVKQIEAGAAVEGLLPSATDSLLLPDLEEAELDLTTFTIRLQTAVLERRLQFADAETADDVFAKLLHRTHHILTLSTDRPDTLHLIRAPLGVIAGILIATLTLALTVSAAADLTSPPANPNEARAWLNEWLRLLAKLDWRWICGVGGGACAWAQLALIRRWHRPPTRLFLTRSESLRHI